MTDPVDPSDRCDAEWEVTPRAVAKMQADGASFVLLDCRTPEEVAICRIDGGLHVPLNDLGLHLSDLREHEETPIVVYCHTGIRSMAVTSFLREQGFDDVRSMAGGIARWSDEVDPEVPKY